MVYFRSDYDIGYLSNNYRENPMLGVLKSYNF